MFLGNRKDSACIGLAHHAIDSIVCRSLFPEKFFFAKCFAARQNFQFDAATSFWMMGTNQLRLRLDEISIWLSPWLLRMRLGMMLSLWSLCRWYWCCCCCWCCCWGSGMRVWFRKKNRFFDRDEGVIEITMDLHWELPVFDKIDMRRYFIDPIYDIVLYHCDFFADIVELFYDFVWFVLENRHALEVFHERTAATWMMAAITMAILWGRGSIWIVGLVDNIDDLRTFDESEEGIIRSFDTRETSFVLTRIQCEFAETIPWSKTHDFLFDKRSVFGTRRILACFEHSFENTDFSLYYDPERVSFISLFEENLLNKEERRLLFLDRNSEEKGWNENANAGVIVRCLRKERNLACACRARSRWHHHLM